MEGMDPNTAVSSHVEEKDYLPANQCPPYFDTGTRLGTSDNLETKFGSRNQAVLSCSEAPCPQTKGPTECVGLMCMCKTSPAQTYCGFPSGLPELHLTADQNTTRVCLARIP